MSAQPNDISFDADSHDLLQFLGLPLDFGSSVLAADEAAAQCQPPPSKPSVIPAAAAHNPTAANPPSSQSTISMRNPELLSRAYSCTDYGLRPPAVQVRLCADGRGWGLFALADFAPNDVLFVETPMHCVAEPETPNLFCNNCLRSFSPAPAHFPHAHLWPKDTFIGCSRGGASCCALYCNSSCRCCFLDACCITLFEPYIISSQGGCLERASPQHVQRLCARPCVEGFLRFSSPQPSAFTQLPLVTRKHCSF